VPGDPGAPHALLASALIAALCATAIRLTGGGLAVLTAAVPMSLLVSIVSLGCMLTSASRPAAGAVLAATAVGLLSFAPRLAILIAQLPLTELDDDRQAAKAIGAHTALTCLVCGFSLSALLGVACAAPDGIAGSSFTAAIASALLLRARWHTDMAQRAAVLAGGILTLAVGFAAAAASWPALTDWQGVAAAGVGAAVLGLGAGAAAASPLVRRAVDFMECVALAVVAPLACWVCGVYGLVLA
jgi:type VII secretion integral membrane protein EccD